MQLSAELKFLVGTPDTFLDTVNAADNAGVIFQDDGTTGYLYAIRPAAELLLLDALHIYDAADVADREQPATVQLFWNAEETAAALIINGRCHALYDFQRQAGFCRTAFPPKAGQTLPRELTNELVDQYFAA